MLSGWNQSRSRSRKNYSIDSAALPPPMYLFLVFAGSRPVLTQLASCLGGCYGAQRISAPISTRLPCWCERHVNAVTIPGHREHHANTFLPIVASGSERSQAASRRQAPVDTDIPPASQHCHVGIRCQHCRRAETAVPVWFAPVGFRDAEG